MRLDPVAVSCGVRDMGGGASATRRAVRMDGLVKPACAVQAGGRTPHLVLQISYTDLVHDSQIVYQSGARCARVRRDGALVRRPGDGGGVLPPGRAARTLGSGRWPEGRAPAAADESSSDARSAWL